MRRAAHGCCQDLSGRPQLQAQADGGGADAACYSLGFGKVDPVLRMSSLAAAKSNRGGARPGGDSRRRPALHVLAWRALGGVKPRLNASSPLGGIATAADGDCCAVKTCGRSALLQQLYVDL